MVAGHRPMTGYYRACCHCAKEYFGVPGARAYLADHTRHHLNGFAWEAQVLTPEAIQSAYGADRRWSLPLPLSRS